MKSLKLQRKQSVLGGDISGQRFEKYADDITIKTAEKKGEPFIEWAKKIKRPILHLRKK